MLVLEELLFIILDRARSVNRHIVTGYKLTKPNGFPIHHDVQAIFRSLLISLKCLHSTALSPKDKINNKTPWKPNIK